MADQNDEQEPLLASEEEDHSVTASRYRRSQQHCQTLLISKQKHYFILGLVALDVGCLLTDILITLIDCDKRIENDAWVPGVRQALEHAGLVFSCLFLAELLLCLWSFGLELVLLFQICT